MVTNSLKYSLLNVLLRGLSLISKFILIVCISKYLSTSELGIYGLFVTTIVLSMYFLGLDFYTFNTREILSKPNNERLPLIRDQFIFHLTMYVIILPLLSMVIIKGIIPLKYAIWFYLILIFEHLSQEFYRLYTVLSKPLFANFVLFLRSGLWVYFVVYLWIFQPENPKNLSIIWVSWSLGAFLSIIISLFVLKKQNLGSVTNVPINWRWIKKGVKVSSPFFIGTLAYKIMEFAGRYAIDFFATKKDVGIYTFFGSVANVINVIVFTAIVMVYYPKLVEFYKKDNQRYKIYLRKFSYFIIILSLTSAIAAIILIKPALVFMGKDEFYNNISVFYILVIANIVLNVSLIPHYILYVKKKDLVIMYSTISGVILNIALNVLLIPRLGIQGAGWAILLSFAVMGFIKSMYSKG